MNVMLCLAKVGASLMLNTLGKNFSRQHFFFIIIFIFPKKPVLTFHANCLQWRPFAWNVKSCFLGKNKKKRHQYVACLISPVTCKGSRTPTFAVGTPMFCNIQL